MARKVCNNKVVFMAGGDELKMRLSDFELNTLRHSSVWYKGDDWEHMTMGHIYHFAIYALFDYEWKSRSKAGRFAAMFPYQKYDNIHWYLETD